MSNSAIQKDETTIKGVFQYIFLHPIDAIVYRWNYKAALLGAILRGAFYFTVYKASKENWVVTLTAVLVELAFRFLTSGVSGAIVQSFRKANPQWLSTLIVTITLPIFGHTVEFISHYGQEKWFSNVFAASENNARQKAFAISVLFSILSAVFNLFAMRQGVLLVGSDEADAKSLWSDIKNIPMLVYEFIVFLPNKILVAFSEKKILNAFAYFLSFGLAVGGILGGFRGKWSWAWTTALGAWVILLFFTVLVAIGTYFYQKKNSSKFDERNITFDGLREETY
jgi:hypothetical protein